MSDNVHINAPGSASAPECIGKYRVHPTASLFPLLEGNAYQELKKSIEQHGQQEPIVLQGDVLIDGRNRLKVLLDLGREPVVEEYSSPLAVEEYILVQNLWRRHLTDDQRMMITTQVMLRKETEAAQARQQAGGKRNGKGRPKVGANSTQPMREPKVTEKIAAAAKGTDHQARRAVDVLKHAPELVEQVATGAMKLKDAAKQVKAAAPKPAAKRSEPNYLDAKTRGLGKLQDVMRELNTVHNTYPGKQEDLSESVDKLVSFGPPPVGGMRMLLGGGRKVTPAKRGASK
jgi:ParB-like chromosome segregation protein Spo0J